jgi:hypothetical protein
MTLQVNPNVANINWETLLQQVGDLSKPSAAGEKPVLTITATAADGTQREIKINIPDDLELPDTVDQAGIDSLCAKLAADSSFGLDDKQIEELRSALTNALQAAGINENIAKLSNSKTVLFDLYKLMALLVEVAQKQRDAARDLRSAESQQIQTAILAQAEQQRTAAITSMIASALCCAVQAAAMAYSIGKQASSFKTQLASLETSGVGSARQNLAMLKAGESAQGAQQQLNSVKNAVGEETANRVGDSFAQATAAKTQVQAREIILREDTAKLQRLQDPNQPLQPADIPPGSDLERAQLRLDQFREMQQLEAKPDRTIPETQRYVELHAQLGGNTTEQQLRTEFDAARTEAANAMRQTVQNDQASLNGSRTSANAKLDATLKTYEDAYDTALRERADAPDNASKADLARLDENLQKAGNELKYARAHVASERIDLTTTEQRRALTAQAEVRLAEAQNMLKGDTSYLEAENTIKKHESYNMLINSVGSCVQNLIQNGNAIMQAEAAKLGAVERMKQEELDQMKDLFAQAGDLVRSVVQLMQAVISAETQSMRDAIQV